MASESLVSSEDLKQFARDLRKVDDKLIKREATRRLKGVATEGVAVAKAAALGIPSNGRVTRGGQKRASNGQFATGTEKPALRPLLARAVRAGWRSTGRDVGVSVAVARARLPTNRQGAEKIVEYGGRHPVFARTAAGPVRPSGGRVLASNTPWVKQEAHPWFRTALAPIREKALVELRKVMDDIATEAGFK